MHFHFRFFELFRITPPPPAAAGHMAQVQEETDRAVRGAAEVHDAIRDFIHGINTQRQERIAREYLGEHGMDDDE